jgi:hypothetical protein
MSNYSYVGSELEIFARATNWKRYFGSLMAPFLGERVLEVGAGMGATTRVLCNERSKQWLCLEPDAQLVAAVDQEIQDGLLPACCSTRQGTIRSLEPDELFDSILYVDVLEHIQEDGQELELAAAHLAPGAALIVLSPAHQWLRTPFDDAIGHHRRYTKTSLAAVGPSGTKLQRLLYLDAAGTLLSLSNRVLLRQSMPTFRQIEWWDRWIVPISRSVDPVLRYSIGKSVLAVWRKS